MYGIYKSYWFFRKVSEICRRYFDLSLNLCSLSMQTSFWTFHAFEPQGEKNWKQIQLRTNPIFDLACIRTNEITYQNKLLLFSKYNFFSFFFGHVIFSFYLMHFKNKTSLWLKDKNYLKTHFFSFLCSIPWFECLYT